MSHWDELKVKLSTQLTRDEGRVAHVYQDHLGYWTIGIGHMVDKRKGGRLGEQVIDLQFSLDIDNTLEALLQQLPWAAQLDEARLGALLNMAFQMGMTGVLTFKNTLWHVQQHNWENAHNNMLQSLWARQTPSRARRIARQMLTGEWQ